MATGSLSMLRNEKTTKRARAGRVAFEPGQDLRYVIDKSVRAPKIEITYSKNFPVHKQVTTEPMVLPSMASYLPHGIDQDASNTLEALYRAHCTSLIECVRYCREKAFFHQISSFQGTLTVPVQRLLFHPQMAAWIEHCDTLLYQRLMSIVGFLLLQVIPKVVIDSLSNIASNLIPHLRKSFSSFPEHSMTAKIAPASIFCSLIRQALRVNVTAHAAANMLSHSSSRDAMYVDMVTAVDVRRIIESVPRRAVDDVIHMCMTKIRKVIDPVDVDPEIDQATVFGMAHAAGEVSPKKPDESPLDIWSNFLHELPELFPYATAEDLVVFTQSITSSVTRDITLSQGSSFGTWWVTKCWIDEYVMFLASSGGFMDRYKDAESESNGSVDTLAKPTKQDAIKREADININGTHAQDQQQSQQQQEEHPSQQGSHEESVDCPSMSMQDESHMSMDGGDLSVMSTEVMTTAAGLSTADRAKFPSPIPRDLVAEVNSGDDSGIGIRTPEEDCRYEFDHGERAEMGAPQTQ